MAANVPLAFSEALNVSRNDHDDCCCGGVRVFIGFCVLLEIFFSFSVPQLRGPYDGAPNGRKYHLCFSFCFHGLYDHGKRLVNAL